MSPAVASPLGRRWIPTLTIGVALLGCHGAGPVSVAPPAADPPPAKAPATGVPEAASPPTAAATPPPATDAPPPSAAPLRLSDAQLARVYRLQPLVAAAAERHGVDANLLNGVIWRESKFNPKARNASGARGLMQLMPVTGRAMAKKLGRSFRPYDAEFSVEAGAKLLSIMLQRFDGVEELALFAFGRGGGRVRKWQNEGGPMPDGVVRFIAAVQRARHTFEEMGLPASAQGR